eukprot:scaffold48_cov395-Prasinococcus_capsulatus_cf.AAC.35
MASHGARGRTTGPSPRQGTGGPRRASGDRLVAVAIMVMMMVVVEMMSRAASRRQSNLRARGCYHRALGKPRRTGGLRRSRLPRARQAVAPSSAASSAFPIIIVAAADDDVIVIVVVLRLRVPIPSHPTPPSPSPSPSQLRPLPLPARQRRSATLHAAARLGSWAVSGVGGGGECAVGATNAAPRRRAAPRGRQRHALLACLPAGGLRATHSRTRACACACAHTRTPQAQRPPCAGPTAAAARSVLFWGGGRRRPPRGEGRRRGAGKERGNGAFWGLRHATPRRAAPQPSPGAGG